MAKSKELNEAIREIFSKTIGDGYKKNHVCALTLGSQCVPQFDGFLKVYQTKTKENILPPLEKDEKLNLIKLLPKQHFTEPPARYNEASLVKALEEEGIGRPSTYSPTISTIQDRNYVEKNEDKRFGPTEIGIIVSCSIFCT